MYVTSSIYNTLFYPDSIFQQWNQVIILFTLLYVAFSPLVFMFLVIWNFDQVELSIDAKKSWFHQMYLFL